MGILRMASQKAEVYFSTKPSAAAELSADVKGSGGNVGQTLCEFMVEKLLRTDTC